VGVAPPLRTRLGSSIAAIRPHHGGIVFAGAVGHLISRCGRPRKLPPGNAAGNGWGRSPAARTSFDSGVSERLHRLLSVRLPVTGRPRYRSDHFLPAHCPSTPGRLPGNRLRQPRFVAAAKREMRGKRTRCGLWWRSRLAALSKASSNTCSAHRPHGPKRSCVAADPAVEFVDLARSIKAE